MTPPFRTVLLGDEDRSGFRSGVEPLDRYFHQWVGQDVRRRITVCVLAVDTAMHEIAGYYTLSAAEVPLGDVPAPMTKRLPRYPALLAARLGRLAVDDRFRGRGIGGALLFDAAARAARSEVAVHALVVDAKDAAAEAFYAHHGLVPYGSSPGTLIAPLKLFLRS